MLLVFVGVLSPDGALLLANRALADSIGINFEPHDGEKFWNCGWWQHDAQLQAKVRDACARTASGECCRYDVEAISADQRLMSIELMLTPMRDEDAAISYLIMSALDVTERKRMETDAYKLAAIVESSNDAIISKDFDGTILSWNHAAEHIFGFTANQAIGQHISIVFPPDRLTEEDDILSRIRKGEHINHYETGRRAKDGQHIPLSLTISPIKNIEGELIGVSKIARDISERYRAEDYIRQLNETLALRVAELEIVNTELESFSYSISHDLRAPLRAINGFSLALLEDYGEQLPDTGKDYLARVRATSEHMANLIKDLLDLARVSRSELHRKRFNLSELATEVANELRVRHPERNVTVQIAEHLEVTGDRGLLRIALENLLGNAWKFTARRDRAEISFGVCETTGKHEYFVRDNGAGFDMTYVNKLFGPFQRLHSNKDFEGTGIGLATVQHIIRRHSGRVRAEGQPDSGATFYFTLP